MKSGKVCILQTFNSVNSPRAADQSWASATSELVGLASATSELVGLGRWPKPPEVASPGMHRKTPEPFPGSGVFVVRDLWSVTSEVIHSFKIIHL